MDFELFMVEKLSKEVENVAAVGFFYELKYDWKEKRITMKLSENYAKEMTSDPSKRTPITEPVTEPVLKRKKDAVKPSKKRKSTKRKTKRKRKP